MTTKSKKRKAASSIVAPQVGAAPLKQRNGKATTAQPVSARVRVVLEVPDGTPSYYSNYIEVSHTKWDFSLILARLPAKHSAAKVMEMQATGVLPLPAEITINFPPTLMAGLIRALNSQKEAYEKETKSELKEAGDESGTKTTK